MNILKAIFSGGCTQITAAEALWQWDQGQILQIVGLDLPDAYQVEFSNQPVRGAAAPMIGGVGGVEIPDVYLTTGRDIYAFVVLHSGETDRETEYRITIHVNARPQPTDVQPTPEQQGVIDQLIAALNAGVDRAEDAADEAEGSAGDAAAQAQAAAQSAISSASSASDAAAQAGLAATAKAGADAALAAALVAQGNAESFAAAASGAEAAAETAQGKAEDAQDAAEAAQAAAESAMAGALAAKAAAETAQGKAEDAQEAAEQAAQDAHVEYEQLAGQVTAQGQTIAQHGQAIAQNTEDITDLDTELTRQKSAIDATLIFPRQAKLTGLGYENSELLYIKPGDNFTVKTADGNPFTVQRLNIADLDGTVNTYYTIQNNSSPFSATISTASTKHETYCVYVTGGTAQEIIVTNNTSVCNAKPYIDAVKETADSTVFMLNQKSINSITDVAVTDGHFSSSGLQQGGSGSSASDFIPVSTGDVITYKLSGSAGWGLLCAYSDADQKTFVSPAIATGAGWSVYQEGTYIVPDGVHYVRFSYITGNVGYSAFSLQLNSSVFPRIKDVAESAVEPIAENAGTVFAANIPEYWNNALSTKIQSIKSNEEYNIIADVCSFVFITDMHYPYNAKQSAKLIKNIVDNTNIRYILNGGDNIHNSSTEVYTPEDCVSVLYDVRKDFKKYCLDESLFSTLGNHDLNTQGTATGLTAMQMYDAVYQKTVDYTEQGGWSWYYQDDKYHKVRFVSVNIYGMNQSQLSWIGDTALNVPDGWTVVLFAHALPFEDTDIGNELNRNALHLKAVLEAYQAKTTVNISDSSTSWPINYTKDFSSYNGEIACFLAGHVHSDNVITDGGITYVTTLNDSLDRRASSGGTTNEQAFDVFTLNKGTKTLKATRIGSGSDRAISY